MKKSYAGLLLAGIVTSGAIAQPSAADPPPKDQNDLGSMSIEDLMKIEVTTASKSAQSLSSVAAAIYVVTAEDIERMSLIFQCVAHPTRIKIIQALFTGELCVCDLAQTLGSSVSAVSHQLRTLRALRLVKYRREGKMAYYSIDDEHVRALFALGLEHVRHR